MDTVTHLEPEKQSTGLDQPGPNRHKRPVLEAPHHAGAELGPVLLEELEHRLENLAEDDGSGGGTVEGMQVSYSDFRIFLTHRRRFFRFFLCARFVCPQKLGQDCYTIREQQHKKETQPYCYCTHPDPLKPFLAPCGVLPHKTQKNKNASLIHHASATHQQRLRFS